MLTLCDSTVLAFTRAQLGWPLQPPTPWPTAGTMHGSESQAVVKTLSAMAIVPPPRASSSPPAAHSAPRPSDATPSGRPEVPIAVDGSPARGQLLPQRIAAALGWWPWLISISAMYKRPAEPTSKTRSGLQIWGRRLPLDGSFGAAV